MQPTTLPPVVRGEWVPMTYEEFLAWVPAESHAEWEDGRGIIFVPASDRHQWTIALLYELISRFAWLFDLGQVIQAPFAMKLWPDGPHREPDVLFVARDHLTRWGRTRVTGPADLVVEVISDDSEERDRVDKLRAYAQAGVPEYLLVDPRPGQEWFGLARLDGQGHYEPVAPDAQGRYHSVVLPGFWLAPTWLWLDPLPRAESLLLEIAPDAYEAWLMAQMRARRRPGDPS